MEHRAADADQRDRGQQHRIAEAEGEQREADEREAHRERQRVGHRAPVGEKADRGLQQRRGQLEHEGDDAGLEERKRVLVAEDRIERRGQRLHHVVEHVRAADGEENAERGGLGRDDADIIHRGRLRVRFMRQTQEKLPNGRASRKAPAASICLSQKAYRAPSPRPRRSTRCELRAVA